ncbi:MAG TPA: SAM-dependent methyltransferase, partial [Thermomicrobiales bacterium]|nr:SAM-dependent methyltransferase [Thermomicrobiales bacterium]
NELLDALPVHRLVVRDGELAEAYATWREGWFAEELGPLSDARLAEPLAGLPLVEGQRLEVSPAAADWTARACREIKRGYAILIDYGYEAAERYDPVERRDGLLRTYWEQIAGDDPFDRVGRQDITAHVDFSAVARAAEETGCDVLGLTTQANFVAGLGVDDLLIRMQRNTDPVEYIRARETVMHLLDPRGLGRFRVLVLGRGIERDPPLRGLSFRWP